MGTSRRSARILRLIDLLADGGVAGIVRPDLPAAVGGSCASTSRWTGSGSAAPASPTPASQECARCGARREPATRDEHGRPVCPNCLITDPANLETCLNCGRRRPVNGGPRTGRCARRCPTLPVAGLLDLRRDDTVRHLPRHRPALVSGLPASVRRVLSLRPPAAIVSGTMADPLCADCTAPPTWRDCPTCSDPNHPHPGQCGRCLINSRLDELMGPDTDCLPPGLRTLRENISTAEHHITAMRWLTKPAIAPVLADLAAGRLPLTHQAFDELGDTQALAHLRQTLVAVGALPERDEELVRLERFLAGLLASQPDPDRRKILHRYTIWHLLRRLRGRNNGRPTSRQQALRIRSHARAAGAFLDWLEAHNLTLGSCTQADLDRWRSHDSVSTASRPATSSAGHAPTSSPPLTSPPSAGAGPPSCWMTSTAGTPRAGFCTTRTSTPRIGSRAPTRPCRFCPTTMTVLSCKHARRAVIAARDAAITLLALTTGLRACDIVNLRLADIDWRARTAGIVQQKTNNPLTVPLTDLLVGTARRLRPRSTARLARRSRVSPFGGTAHPAGRPRRDPPGDHRTFRAAGVTDVKAGSRLLRHNAASRLLRAAVPLPTISAVLGHASPESTNLYLSVDQDRLLECVLDVPDGPRS